ncbi:Co-chaperone protein DjlA [Serratia symbiotica]|nr:Co-chaperone protein DjlA [Serratia symbiotica]
MQYWGKLLGVIGAIWLDAGFWAVVFGLIIGHMLDNVNSHKKNRGFFTDHQTRQALFFRTTFQVMGHLSKSKGRVTEVDIQIAILFMDRLQLHGEARIAAQQAFREGKQSQFPLRETLQQLRSICFARFDLIRIFLEIQIQAAFSDGTLHPNERQVLYVIAEELGISHAQFDQFLSMIESGRRFDSSDRGGYEQERGEATIEDAYKVLGVTSQADTTTIKRAYRKLMSEHHPDKLVAKGLPPQMMEMAKQKAQEIQAAYDLIKNTRNFK